MICATDMLIELHQMEMGDRKGNVITNAIEETIRDLFNLLNLI